MTQLAIGLLLGLLVGMVLRQLKPVVVLLLVAASIFTGMVIYESGLPGLVRLLDGLAIQARLYPAFFASLAVGKLIGGALASGR